MKPAAPRGEVHQRVASMAQENQDEIERRVDPQATADETGVPDGRTIEIAAAGALGWKEPPKATPLARAQRVARSHTPTLRFSGCIGHDR